MKKNPFCINCGDYGHIYKKCTKPITSCGIIMISLKKLDIKTKQIITLNLNNNLYNIDNFNYINLSNIEKIKKFYNSIYFLMIRRKHSLNYIEFIRGKYNLNFESVKKMFLLMSKEEVKYILNNDFDTIWQNVWKNTSNLTKYLKEYNKSKNKFNIIINKYRNDLLKLNIIYDEPEWEFPKGRRLYNENNIKCAIREFKEETYIDNITINNNIVPIKEEFKGTNEKDYMNIFYLSINNINNNINNNIINKEVSIISFLNYNDIIKKLRVYNKSKIIILHKILLLLTSLSEYTSNNNFISY
jgi:hypothetical protein